MDRRPVTMQADAFVRSLYDDSAGPLFAFALRLTGDRFRAEDVVQETLVRAWRRADRLDPGSDALRGWLFTVARNLVTDLRRSDAVRPVAVWDDSMSDDGPRVDDVETATQRLVLTAAIGLLTPEHRDALFAVFYEGRSVAEAAEWLGVPQGTVKSRTYYALRALRHALDEGSGATR
jgi:RNA polymerase sigma-70 factor (ECF subfamily)